MRYPTEKFSIIPYKIKQKNKYTVSYSRFVGEYVSVSLVQKNQNKKYLNG